MGRNVHKCEFQFLRAKHCTMPEHALMGERDGLHFPLFALGVTACCIHLWFVQPYPPFLYVKLYIFILNIQILQMAELSS